MAKAAGAALGPATMVESRYSHRECVEAHLDLMMFLLKEGDLYLSWSRCRELWDTLVDNPNSIQGYRLPFVQLEFVNLVVRVH